MRIFKMSRFTMFGNMCIKGNLLSYIEIDLCNHVQIAYAYIDILLTDIIQTGTHTHTYIHSRFVFIILQSLGQIFIGASTIIIHASIACSCCKRVLIHAEFS